MSELPGEDPFVRLWNHAFQVEEKWFIDGCPSTVGEACPVCEANAELWKAGNTELVSIRKRKLYYISNVLVVRDPKQAENDGKVFLFKYGKKIFDKINSALNPLFPDAADIKYIVISHAHGDHDGAVKFLQDTYHPHVILAPKDWELASRQAIPYAHDMDATDGQKLTLGDTTITIYFTPGHTGGTLSFLVPVKDQGVPHLAFEWGGTALSGNTSKEMLQSYISNAVRMKDIVDGAGADVIIGNHTEYNNAIDRLARTNARKSGEPNPWVVGKIEVGNYLTVVEECAKSWLAINEGRL